MSEFNEFEKGYLMAQILRERAKLREELELTEQFESEEFKKVSQERINAELSFTENIARKLKPELFKD